MKKVVLTIKEDICSANNKDVNATELLKVMARYGIVETFESVEANIKAEYQKINDNLSAQLNAIKEQDLTADEIRLVKAYRENKQSIISEYAARNEQLAKQLQAVKDETEQRNAKIMALLGE